ncbi:outer membrane lipoprotein-sorting protein [Methanosarcina sp. KYL-1]|uniref:outer membrane lipoprotein-sorting protein n=1 Tax=Methanosarcina sp. KYL-1 TaxID=2602068 RepID=UPI002101CF06|nr:outer membrane lipoprotein-sorting protein [Methanosarcina sp. KYL-1]MCQ1534127.1 outer membrane lipoprotein-sorting protein [Methanosarcina sp. KYL-1]
MRNRKALTKLTKITKLTKLTKPTKPTKLILLALLVLALFASGCMEKELSAEEIAARMLEKQGSIEDYSYTMHMTSYMGEKVVESEFKTMYKKPHMMKNFLQEPEKEEETLVLSDGEFRWTYAPGTNTVIKTKLPETPELTGDDYLSLIGITLNDMDVSLLGTEEIEGREAYLLEATPKVAGEEAPAYSMKIWVDKETWMLLGYEMYDSSGTLISKVEVRDLKVNTGIPDSEFEFKIPEGATVKTVENIKTVEYGELNPSGELSLEEAEERVGFEILIPEYLPEGYEFSHATAYNTSETAPEGQASETVVLTYKEGEASVILTETSFEGQAPDAAIMNSAEDIAINGKEGKYLAPGDMKVLKWKLGNVDLNLRGTLDKEEILKIAESISEEA